MGRMALRRAGTALAAALVVAAVALPPRPAGGAVPGELVVADRRAAVALYGFDPVSYFLAGEARNGSDSVELVFAGLTWRFASEANRAAFRAEPDAYVPRFGGYDPIALARGAPTAGHPLVFAVHENRLYLFYRPENRAAFLAAPRAALEAAQAQWPRVRRSLVH